MENNLRIEDSLLGIWNLGLRNFRKKGLDSCKN